MAQLEMVLPSLPVVVPVEKNTVPEVAKLLEPDRVQLVMVLLLASFIKRIVEVPAVAETVVLIMDKEFTSVFRPLMVTLSAPLKLMSALPAVVAPVMIRGPSGIIVSEAHAPAFREAEEDNSSVFFIMVTEMLAPV